MAHRIQHYEINDPFQEKREQLLENYEQISYGLVCKLCHAQVSNLGSHPQKHLDWHGRTDGQLPA